MTYGLALQSADPIDRISGVPRAPFFMRPLFSVGQVGPHRSRSRDDDSIADEVCRPSKPFGFWERRNSDDATLVVIPAFNEQGNIGPLIEETFAVVPHGEVVVVDDGSEDGTTAEVKALLGVAAAVYPAWAPGLAWAETGRSSVQDVLKKIEMILQICVATSAHCKVSVTLLLLPT